MAFALRPIRAEDASAFFAEYASDAEAILFHPFEAHKSVVETELFVTLTLAAIAAGTQIMFAITDMDGRAIGNIDFRFKDGTCEIGFTLGRKYWNQGIMTRALRGAVEMVKAERPNVRYFAYVDAENYASRRVLAKNGFVPDPAQDKREERAKLNPLTRHMLYVELPTS